MSRKIRSVGIGLAVGVGGLLLHMPLNNSCILNFDRSAKPVQLAGPDENPFGMIACDDFEGVIPRWLLASLLLALLCIAGGIGAHCTDKKRVLFGAVTSGGAMLLAFLVGSLIYPRIEAYWMSPRDLLVAVPAASLLGAIGGWLNQRPPNKTMEPTR